MTLRIRRADYQTFNTPPSTYKVHPDQVLGHLLILASGGAMDTLVGGFGEDTDQNDPHYSIIRLAYDSQPDTSAPAGVVQQRMLDLVNGMRTIDIVGVDEQTTWSSGETTSAAPADTLGSTVFYATSICEGKGRKVSGANGDQPCTPVVGILYHEMAHAFHGHPVGTKAEDEAVAITDENDLRAAMGLAPRSTTDLKSECGCTGPGGGDGSCCIIATVATGAPYGPDINRLRALRDQVFRSTELGDRFFQRLHEEYYGFSIDVARILVRSPSALAAVERLLVRPLIGVLGLLTVVARAEDDEEIALAFRETVGLAIGCLSIGEDLRTFLVETPEFAPIRDHLVRHLAESPHVLWAIGAPLMLLARSQAQLSDQSSASEIARWWKAVSLEWLLEMPLWSSLEMGDRVWREDVTEIAGRVLSSPASRALLASHWSERRWGEN